jgi:predicted SAM-dependent methyltransferase
MKLLNIGCGTKFICSSEWTNIDINANHKCVISHNIVEGLPFQNDSFDVVYHSNILEHLEKKDAVNFINECYRVLKKGGILRIAVPDLEEIAKQYLLNLNNARNGVKNAEYDYDWILIELLDQMTRTNSGGLMGEYLNQKEIKNKEYIYKRIGEDGKKLIEHFENKNNTLPAQEIKKNQSKIKLIFKRHFWKYRILNFLLKDTYQYMKLAEFRSHGEVHQWMYDNYSMKILLQKIGFTNVENVTAIESNILDWAKFELDVKNNNILKPDSFFTEAIK